jgi:hypothetical protein
MSKEANHDEDTWIFSRLLALATVTIGTALTVIYFISS